MNKQNLRQQLLEIMKAFSLLIGMWNSKSSQFYACFMSPEGHIRKVSKY